MQLARRRILATGDGGSAAMSRHVAVTTVLVLLLASWLGLAAQEPVAQATSTPAQHSGPAADSSVLQTEPGPAAELYRQLSNTGLDPKAVYKIRDASIDREDLHISLDDGVIGFTQTVNGRVTGAYFQGEGDILLIPPDQVERASLAMFTGAAVLEEKFRSAYFRFNDSTDAELRAALRAPKDGTEFVAENDRTVRGLSQQDALRLLATFLNSRPVAGREDHVFRARLDGIHLGIFDVVFDTLSSEQIAVAKFARDGDTLYYDVLNSFAMRSSRREAALHPSEQEVGYSAIRGDLRIYGYRIRASIEPPRTFSANASLTVASERGGDRLLVFELSRYLKVRAVHANGRPAEFLQNEAIEGTELSRQGNDLVAVVLPEPLRAGERMELNFAYEGDVLSEAGGGLMYVGARGFWYPNRGPAMADFDLEFHAPKEWTVVATGKRVLEKDEGREKISRWVSEKPIPIAGFNVGEYERETAKAGSVEVEVYASHGLEKNFPQVAAAPGPALSPLPPITAPSRSPARGLRGRVFPEAVLVPTPAPLPQPNRNAERVARNAARAIEFFSRAFGPFPYHSLALSQRPGPVSQGWPGLVFLSSYVFLSPEEHAGLKLSPFQTTVFEHLMTAHEVAHQWWGDLVGWRSYHDQWLSEALASYSALLAIEKDDPRHFQQVMDYYREQLISENHDGHKISEAGPVTLGPRLSSSRFPNGFELVAYGRGTWLLHMLRTLLRDEPSFRSEGRHARHDAEEDEPFIRALRNLRQRFEGKEISTRDLQQVLEEEVPDSLRFERRKSLDWFFKGWVNGTAIPRFELKDVKFLRKGPQVSVSGTILQKDAPDDLVTSVPVYADTGKGLVLLGRVFADGNETSFRLRAPAGSRKLALDPYHTLLSKP